MLSNAASRMKYLVLCGLLALASANKIHRIEVYTSDCFQCGMSVLGKISLEVYGQVRQALGYAKSICSKDCFVKIRVAGIATLVCWTMLALMTSTVAPSAPLQAAPLATATTTTWVTPGMMCP